MVQDTFGVCLAGKTISFSTRSETINPDDLPQVGVHDRDHRQWVSIEVGVGVAVLRVLSEAQSLEVPTVLGAKVETTVRPAIVNLVYLTT